MGDVINLIGGPSAGRDAILTDYGEIHAAIASWRAPEVHSASVEPRVRFPNVVNGQPGRLLERGEESSLAQHVLVGPVTRPSSKLVPSIVPVTIHQEM